jgi:hypothetical protein
MNDRNKFEALAVLVASVVAASLLFVACRDASPSSVPKNGLPAEYLGRWYFDGTSGGIDGREVAAADGSWIEVTALNTIEHYSPDGRLGSTEVFEPTRGPSIFSESDAWILGAPDSIARVIEVHPEGFLTISENVYDGFGSKYARHK